MVKRQLNQRGFTLEATLIFLVLLTALIGAGMASMLMVQRAAGIDYRGSRVVYATEAGADNVMSQLATFISDGILTDPELAAVTAPAITGFTFTAPVATRVGSAVYQVIGEGTYAGLYSLNQQIDIRTTATDAQGDRSTAVVSVNAQSIPLFQFGVFYQGDLEIHNGPADGLRRLGAHEQQPVPDLGQHVFQDNVTAADSVFWRRKASSDRGNGVYINNSAGDPIALSFDSRSDPGSSFVTKSNASFDGRLMNSSSGVTPLNLPLPAGLPPTVMVDPKAGGDDAAIKNVKFAWKADLHIVAKADKLSDAAFCANAMVMDRGPRVVPTAAECALIFSGQAGRFPRRPGERRRRHVPDRHRRARGLDPGEVGRQADRHHLHHVRSRDRHAGRSVHRRAFEDRLPGRPAGEREHAALPAHDRHGPSGVRLGRLQQRGVAACVDPGRRDHLPLAQLDRRAHAWNAAWAG